MQAQHHHDLIKSDKPDKPADHQTHTHPFCNSASCRTTYGPEFDAEREAETSFICDMCLEKAGRIDTDSAEDDDTHYVHDPEFYFICAISFGIALAFFI